MTEPQVKAVGNMDKTSNIIGTGASRMGSDWGVMLPMMEKM